MQENAVERWNFVLIEISYAVVNYVRIDFQHIQKKLLNAGKHSVKVKLCLDRWWLFGSKLRSKYFEHIQTAVSERETEDE